jgi:hypothetical protein
MGANRELTAMGVPVPELPVVDVERAQEHYRDALGFDIGWLYPGKEIGSVSRGNAAIFFRKRVRPFEPAVHWIFADDLDASYNELISLGARIVEPLERSRGGYGSSRSRISMATASTSTTIDERPPTSCMQPRNAGRADAPVVRRTPQASF